MIDSKATRAYDSLESSAAQEPRQSADLDGEDFSSIDETTRPARDFYCIGAAREGSSKPLASRRRPQVQLKLQEDLMSNNHLDHHDPVDPARPVLERIHPWIYAIAVGLVAWFALSAWVLFDHGFGQHSEVSLSLTMMSVLFLVAVLLPWTLFRVWTRHRIREEGQPSDVALRDWGLRDFSVWGAKIKGSHAAIDVLLPLAAVAFGLTAIGIVFLIEAGFAS